eukprot:5486790-Pleurochrysis_carterae.AAC.2
MHAHTPVHTVMRKHASRASQRYLLGARSPATLPSFDLHCSDAVILQLVHRILDGFGDSSGASWQLLRENVWREEDLHAALGREEHVGSSGSEEPLLRAVGRDAKVGQRHLGLVVEPKGHVAVTVAQHREGTVHERHASLGFGEPVHCTHLLLEPGEQVGGHVLLVDLLRHVGEREL